MAMEKGTLEINGDALGDICEVPIRCLIIFEYLGCSMPYG